jgi:NADH-quinone oxidoreductase subunit L
MFRLVFLAFHGPRRVQAAHAHGHAAPSPVHPEEDEPAAHAGHLHDAPRTMAIPLIVLAVGAVFAGYVGVPEILGGGNRMEHFLAPSFTVSERASDSEAGAATGAESGQQGAGQEWALMGTATVAAFVGIGLAALFWLKRRDLADAAADRFPGLYRLLVHKYYVDEIYDTSVVQPIKTISEHGLWKGVDQGIIDGAVNGAGVSVRGASGWLRRLQTGSLRAYAASLFVGVLLVLAYVLWP